MPTAVESTERAYLEIPRESLIGETERGGEKVHPSVQAWLWLERVASIYLPGQHPEEVVLGEQFERRTGCHQLGSLQHLPGALSVLELPSVLHAEN
jgi:hypothetical protein